MAHDSDKHKAKEAHTSAVSEDERAELEALREQQAARNETGGKGAGAPLSEAGRRRALEAKLQADAKAERDLAATEEVIIRPGRHVFLDPGMAYPVKGGSKVMVTPEEAAKLAADGHLIADDGTLTEIAGPKVYQEAGLVLGNGPGQGQAAAKK